MEEAAAEADVDEKVRGGDSSSEDMFSDFEAELEREMEEEAPAAAAVPVAAPETAAAAPTAAAPEGAAPLKRPYPSTCDQPSACEEPSAAQAPSVQTRPEQPAAAASSVDAAEEQDEEDEVGYLWGMDIRTGQPRDDAVRQKGKGGGPSRGASSAKKALVRFTHGSYQGVELSENELRRMKAEERANLVFSRRLALVLDLDHTLLNSAAWQELPQEACAPSRL